MEFEVEVSDVAASEIDAAVRWIAAHSPEYARRWYLGLRQKLHTLEHNPHRCSQAAESDAFVEDVRELLYGNRRSAYRILFQIGDAKVTVLHVRHSARRFLNE